MLLYVRTSRRICDYKAYDTYDTIRIPDKCWWCGDLLYYKYGQFDYRNIAREDIIEVLEGDLDV